MVLSMKLADVGVGAIVGAVIAGAVLIFLDQRRRSDERKNRYQDVKQRGYRDFLYCADLLANDVRLVAASMPAIRRPRLTPDLAGLELAKDVVETVTGNMPKYENHLMETLSDMTMLWPAPSIQ